jgi:hypothetical protein
VGIELDEVRHVLKFIKDCSMVECQLVHTKQLLGLSKFFFPTPLENIQECNSLVSSLDGR